MIQSSRIYFGRDSVLVGGTRRSLKLPTGGNASKPFIGLSTLIWHYHAFVRTGATGLRNLHSGKNTAISYLTRKLAVNTSINLLLKLRQRIAGKSIHISYSYHNLCDNFLFLMFRQQDFLFVSFCLKFLLFLIIFRYTNFWYHILDYSILNYIFFQFI